MFVYNRRSGLQGYAQGTVRSDQQGESGVKNGARRLSKYTLDGALRCCCWRRHRHEHGTKAASSTGGSRRLDESPMRHGGGGADGPDERMLRRIFWRTGGRAEAQDRSALAPRAQQRQPRGNVRMVLGMGGAARIGGGGRDPGAWTGLNRELHSKSPDSAAAPISRRRRPRLSHALLWFGWKLALRQSGAFASSRLVTLSPLSSSSS